MMTIKDIKKIYQGQYSDIEVYSGDSFHTDSCQPVDDYKDNFVVKKWQLMDEEDYNSTILANCGIRFEEIHEKIDKILCLLITGDREVIAIRNIPYDYDTTDEMTDFHIFVADDMETAAAELIRIGADDEHYSTEEYTADEDGEFVMGSDIDTPSNFIRRTCAQRSVKDICNRAGMSQNSVAKRFGIPWRTFSNWCTNSRECPEYTRLMMQELLGLYRR